MILDGVLFWAKAIPLLLLILVPLVLVHEFGHFVIARLVKIRVLEFGLGFPPRAKVLGHDHETEYTLNWLPIGGFVRLEGEEADSDDPRSFVAASLWKQLLVLVAGVTMNVLTAVVLLFIVAWAFNPVVRPTISSPIAGSPAETAGLNDGDVLISLNGQQHSVMEFGTDSTKSWHDDLAAHAGQSVTLVVADKNGVQRTVVLTLHVPDAKENWALGVSMTGASMVTTAGNPVEAAGLAVDGTRRAMGLIVVALGDLVAQVATHPTEAPAGVSGPVGIASTVGTAASQPDALMVMLLLAAVISANLALVNFLPFPPLDGGKMVIMIIKRVVGAKGVGKVEQFAYLAGFAFLMAFIAWISFFDIIRAGQ
ncbi:MAG TPA: M50 family metallopeptidase [Candidatus Limnocylindrales bacterium]